MGLRNRSKGFGIYDGSLGQIGVRGPLGVVMNADVEVLLVGDLGVGPGEQIDGRYRPVEGWGPKVEAAVPAGTKTVYDRRRDIGIEGDRQFQLFADLSKAPQGVGVVLLEIAEAWPPGPRRGRDVRPEAGGIEVRVEREIGESRCPGRIRVPEADRLKPI